MLVGSPLIRVDEQVVDWLGAWKIRETSMKESFLVTSFYHGGHDFGAGNEDPNINLESIRGFSNLDARIGKQFAPGTGG